ncbi:DUF3047 domain-containing protein [Salinisphaera sp. LB1]|uniref:DUF3047 domain-containing protein n=1 Tax=Salinisphaera sp. LB1 TaxID=2183911 RepID=UPI001314B297|nr:DUF3047 domain-containing protein [Salinisphaera sp. LB1]
MLGSVLALLLATPAAAAPTVMIGRFAPGSLAAWEHKSFKGETRYRLVGHGNARTLEATCDASASAIALRRKVDLRRTPVLRWEWRVDHIYPGLDGTTRAGDDYPARVYVIHDGGVMLWRTRAVNYVWANSEPRGAHWPNAFTDKAMMVAVQSGPPADPDTWVAESRNVRADFKRFYGLDLHQIDGVALMTDCDNSGRSGRAEYRNIRFTAH